MKTKIIAVVGAGFALFGGTAHAAIVHFDLTRDLPYASSIGGSGTPLPSDKGTTLLLTNTFSSGNIRDYVFSPDGKGSGNGDLNFHQIFPDPGTLGHDFGIHGGFGGPATGFTYFNFGHEVEILSIDFLILTPGDTWRSRANITLDTTNTNTVIYDPTVDGSVLAPKPVTYTFPGSSLAEELSIQYGSNSAFSIRSITVNDASAIPEPSSAFIGALLGAVVLLRSRRRAA